MDKASEAAFQFEEHCNSSGYGQCGQRQDHSRCQVVRREQAKTSEQQSQPEDQKSDERLWRSLSNLLCEQPP